MDISPLQGILGGEYPYSTRMTRKEYFQKWYEANKHRYRGYYQNRKARNPEAVRAERKRSAAKWRAAHPEYKSVRSEASRIKNRESRRLWREQNPDLAKQQRRESMKRAYEANPEKYRTRAKTWRANNLALDGERQKKYRRKRLPLFRAYYQNRLDTDPNFKMAAILRNRLKNALKRGTKSGSAIKLLGCSIPTFWIYLEAHFEDGMTRENHGSIWHLDHIEPCAGFDMTKPEHQRRAFHWSNLQPLFAEDNLRKGAKQQKQQQ